MKEPAVMMGFDLYRSRHKSRYKHYDPRKHSSKSVLWFTREEVQVLKSIASAWNFFVFLLSLVICLIIFVLYMTTTGPFHSSEGNMVFATLGVLFVYQALISFVGYSGAKTENSCVIDFYIAVKGILIVSYVLVIVHFNKFGELFHHYFITFYYR